MGVHLTYSPAVDIARRPKNPAEGGRSFGGDIDLLGRIVRAYVRGYHDNGMLTGAKHFPGRGDVERYPAHPGFTWNPKPADAVTAQDFGAFRRAIDAGVDYVMTEHVAVPSITGGSDLPASVERRLATDWLRDSLGFKGMLTSDDLWYDYVVARFGPEEVAVRAFEAGHDIILEPKDHVRTIAALAGAVRSGRLSEQRVNAAVRRLLTLNARLNLQSVRLVDETRLGARVGTLEHWNIAQEVADRSLTMVKNDGVLPLARAVIPKIVNISVQKLEADPSPAVLATRLATAFPGVRSFTLTPRLDSTSRDDSRRGVAGGARCGPGDSLALRRTRPAR
jgi:beta-N-acetylhexosaminidase